MKLIAIIASAVLVSAPSPKATANDAVPVAAPAVPLEATSPADAILGKWWSEGREGLMKIEKTVSGHFQVRVIDGKDANAKDANNPDPKLRERKLKDIVLMWNLRFEDGEYIDGYCYNPRDGNTYRVMPGREARGPHRRPLVPHGPVNRPYPGSFTGGFAFSSYTTVNDEAPSSVRTI